MAKQKAKPKSKPRFKGKVEREMTSGSTGLFALRRSKFEQPYRDAVRPFPPARSAEILPAAACSPRRSSNAKRLDRRDLPRSSGIVTGFQRDRVRTDMAVRVLPWQ